MGANKMGGGAKKKLLGGNLPGKGGRLSQMTFDCEVFPHMVHYPKGGVRLSFCVREKIHGWERKGETDHQGGNQQMVQHWRNTDQDRL